MEAEAPLAARASSALSTRRATSWLPPGDARLLPRSPGRFLPTEGQRKGLARESAMGGTNRSEKGDKRGGGGFGRNLCEQPLIRGFFLLGEIITALEFAQPREKHTHLCRKRRGFSSGCFQPISAP